jgi:hypothetical protein
VHGLQETDVWRPIFTKTTLGMAKLQSAIFGDPKLQFSVEISTLEEGATEGEREREREREREPGAVGARYGGWPGWRRLRRPCQRVL